MNAGLQRFCVWCGPAMILLFFGGFAVAGFLPPPPPTEPVEEVARRYQEDATQIRIGMEMVFFAAALCVPWIMAFGLQLKRAEGSHPVVASAQTGLGILLPLEFIVPVYCFMVAAYRPDRPASEVRLLNDLGWLPFVGLVYTFVVQVALAGVAVLSDKRANPVYPRWFGYYCFWVATLAIPSGFNVFFHSGPMAWDGLIAWWLIAVDFGIWAIVMTALTLRAITNQQREQEQELGSTGHEPAVPVR